MVQTKVSKPNALHELGYKIFLDRYAQKDMTRKTLAVGDTVIVVVDSKTGQREIGTVTAMALPEVTVQLRDGESVKRDVEHVDKPLETAPEQMMDRVAAGIAEIEKNAKLRKEWTQKFRWLLDDWKFVPGGRILTGAGTDQELTYYNCYVVPSPKDSRHGIMATLTQMTEIMSRGGGVGINISTLRPKHAYVKGVNGRSSGSVSWGALYSFVTGLIEQGGCFGGDVKISTDKGLIPARELADRMDDGETFYAHTHQGLRKITARFRNGIKPLYAMTTDRGYQVEITEDHKVAVLMDGKVTTMPLKYLHEGDEILLLSPRTLETANVTTVAYQNSVGIAYQPQIVADTEHELLPDTITSITPLGDAQVYDFEVDDVHLLSGNGIYTSNSRRGALMLILNDWHPDVFNFINSKRQAGNITNANISVGVSDKLMEAVKKDGDWDLVFPDTSEKGYDTDWDGDLEKWIASGRKVLKYRTVKAKEVWDAIIESAWASAEPGVWFRERSNKMSNSWYFSQLISTNPCFTGDMRLHTDKGLVTVRELFDDETQFEAVIDGRFGVENRTVPSTRVFMTGTKPVFKLQTKEGFSVRTTAEHRFMTPRGWVELQDLKVGDVVHVLNRKGAFGQEGSLEMGRELGMFATQTPTPVGVVNVAQRDEARVQSQRLRTMVAEWGMVDNKLQVPEVVFKGTEAMQRGYLQALFTADGGVQFSPDKQSLSIRLASSHLPLLESVQVLLGNFGIVSRLYRYRRESQMRLIPDGKGGQKEYLTQASHELVISRANLLTFRDEIGFLTSAKNDKLAQALATYVGKPYSESYTATVESIKADGIEEVFDITTPLTHSLVLNNFVLHNCGEQPLAGWSVCNLGAINLAKFYDPEKHDVAWDDLAQTVRYATRFLDNVIDSTPYFFEENKNMQLSERRVGLGTMGVAELMIYCGVRYGSDESITFIEKLYKHIAVNAYETSAGLAQEKGAFSQFNAEKFLQSGFMMQMPDDVRENIRKQGIRNVTLLTQAPTGTTGTLVNTSTGIEPFFSWVYYRKSRLGLHEEQVPVVAEWYAQNPHADKLPDFFITAMELSPEEHVKVQGAFQKWIDSAISKTSNVPNHYTVPQVSDLYMQMYELGCKGGTIYRDGSRDEQVLMLKGDERAESEMENLKKKDDKATAKKEDRAEVAHTPHKVYPRPIKLSGTTVSFKTPFGTAYITMNNDENGNPFEVFITVGKAGSDIQADAEAMGRMISLQLRTTAPQNRREMLRLIKEQLHGIGGARPMGFGPNRVLSLPDAMATALEQYYFVEDQPQQLGLPIASPEVTLAPAFTPKSNGTHHEATNGNGNGVALSNGNELHGYGGSADMCPECGTISLLRVEGCRKCTTCGYSEC
jgi:ribonucleoside-diphosphate reductase alpha chain